MTDIHNHILFDIDDGAEDIETSVEMCLDSYKNKFSAIVVTPHFFDFSKLYEFTEYRNHNINILRHVLEQNKIKLSVLPGAELFLGDGIFLADNLDSLTINGTRYMLCEFPMGPFDIKKAPMWVDELIDRGYIPIIAHPERYYEFHNNFALIDELLSRNILFQVNLDSLAGKNGERAQMMGVDMVKRRIAKLIATDAHEPHYRHTRITEIIPQLPPEIEYEDFERCFMINPDKIIKNERV